MALGGSFVVTSTSDHALIPNPPSGKVTMYHYSVDGLFYVKDSAGTHTAVGSPPGAGAILQDGTVAMAATFQLLNNAVLMDNISTPSTPASGLFKLYLKSDGKLYILNDAATETQVGGGTLSSPTVTTISDDAQSLTTATFVDVTLTAAQGSLAAHFDQSDTTKLVADATAAGDWLIEAYAVFNCIAGGAIGTICQIELRVNGSAVARSSKGIDGVTSTQVQTMPIRVTLADTDEITLAVKQSSGSTINLHSSLTDAWSGLILTKVS